MKEINIEDVKAYKYYYMEVNPKDHDSYQFAFQAEKDYNKTQEQITGDDIYHSIDEYKSNSWVFYKKEIYKTTYKIFEITPDDHPEYFI